MASLISTTTPLAANGTWTSPVHSLSRATQITGSVFADVPGTLYVDQGGDGINFDLTTSYLLTGAGGEAIEVDVLSRYMRVRYVNGATPQTTLRVYVDIRDLHGEFLTASVPSPGGAWVVLLWDPGRQTYSVVGRFDADNGWAVNSMAAVFTNKNGKYASFVVDDAVVTQETLQTISEHSTDAF